MIRTTPGTVQCKGYRRVCAAQIPASKRSGLCYFCERSRDL